MSRRLKEARRELTRAQIMLERARAEYEEALREEELESVAH